MKITGIDYERLFPLGPYENERITLHADVDVTENPYDAFKDMKATCFQLHEEGKLLEESKKVVDADKLDKPTEAQPQYDIIKTVTRQAEGPNGAYLQVKAEDNKGNSDYDALIKDLKDNNGKLTRQGYFCWLFSDNKTVGMKISKR